MAVNAFGDQIVEESASAGVNVFGDPVVGGTAPNPQQVKSIGDAILFGLRSSSTGLAVRGKMPEQQLGEDAPWYHRISAAAGGVAGDLPAGVVGAAVLSRAGPMGMMVGGFAAPMGLRAALVEAYTGNHATSWQGAWEIAKAGLTGVAKGAVIGLATAGAGRVVAPFLAPMGKAVEAIGTFGTELAALTTTAAAVEGHLPSWQDFMDNAILLGGMKGAVHTAKGLAGIWGQTGKEPAAVLADAQRDPTIKAAAEKGELPEAYAPLALEQKIKAFMEADQRPEEIRAIMGAKEPPKLGEKPIGDPLPYEYITDSDALKGILRLTEQKYAEEISTQTRGVVTNKATAADALRLVAAGDIAEHVVGAADNAAQIYGRAHILKGVTQNAFDKITALKGIDNADMTPRMKLEALAAVEQLSMVLAEFRGARAEAGRALQVFQALKRDAGMLGEAETIVKLAERKGSLQDIAAMVADMKDPAQMQRFAEGYTKATTTEKLLEAWKAGILSGPQTHLANILGNTTKWIAEVPESVLAASLTAAGKMAKGDPMTLAQYKARAFAPIYGLQMGAVDAIKVAGEVWRQKGEHLEKADQYRAAIEGQKGEVIRTPFRLLQVEDALFRTIAERAKAHEMAVDRLIEDGIHPETTEGRARVVQYTERPEFGLSEKAGLEAIETVQLAGAEAVFSQRLGPRLEQVQRAMAGHPIGLIIPFFRTPANLVSWAVQHTPGLNLLSGRWRDDFAAGGERQARAIARVTIGAGLATAVFAAAQDGLVTGGGLFNREERGTKTAAGWQAYSIKVGDKYYSYQRIEPVAKVMGLAADLVELIQNSKDDEDKAKAASMLVLMFGNATISTTYLSGLSNAMQSLTDPTRYGENFLEQYASSLVPKIVGQMTTMADPYRREVEGTLDAIQSQIPFLREKLLPKRDVWGEPVKGDRLFEVMPVAASQISEDKVKKEAMRLHVAINNAPKFIMERGPFNAKEKRTELTIDQRDFYKQVSGKNAMTILGPIVSAPDWERIPDFAKAAIYKAVLEGTRKQGAFAALPPDDAARMTLREKIVEKIIKQTQEAEGTAAPAPERRVK